MKKIKFLSDFFYEYPALFFALFFLLGIAFFLYEKFILFIFFIFAFSKKKLIFSSLIFISAYFYCSYFYSDIKKIKNPIESTFNFKINSIKEVYNFNTKYFQYSGTVHSSDSLYHNIQVSMSAKKYYSPSFIYQINGKLFANENYNFYIKTKKNWEKKSPSFNLAEIRFKLKKAFYSYLKKTIKDKDSINFLHTLITGENTHKLLSFSFSKIGLQHVLAISGFHFNIFTMFFAFFLRLFLPRKIVIYVLLILVNLYFLFLGPLISVQRAYLMIQIALFAQIANRKYLALNALGISMIIILIFDPLSFKSVGFQLSYLCTFSILLIYPSIEELSKKVLKKRTLTEINDLNQISKIGLKTIEYLRQNICLCVSVNIFIIPVILFYFHKFALLSLIYNLFIPFLVGFLLMGVMIGAIFYYLPLIGFLINSMNAFFTKIVLNLISYPPASLEFYLRNKSLTLEFVVIYLAIISLTFLSIRNYLKKDQLPEYCNFL